MVRVFMLMRLVCSGIVVFWAIAMGWLIHHDVIPAITARDVPRLSVEGWSDDQPMRSQARIEDKTGRHIGNVWSIYSVNQNSISRRDVFWIERLSILPMLRIEVDSTFTPEGKLDELLLQLYGAGQRIELKGEDISGNFAFQLTVGHREPQLFKIDASAAGMLGDVFRPFPVLPGLEVGQSWRLHIVNPLAAISGVGSKLIPMIVKVTSRESLPTEDGPVDCFVVDSDHGARAWVDDKGNVLRQEVDVPIGGHLTIVAEPFDELHLEGVLQLELSSG